MTGTNNDQGSGGYLLIIQHQDKVKLPLTHSILSDLKRKYSIPLFLTNIEELHHYVIFLVKS